MYIYGCCLFSLTEPQPEYSAFREPSYGHAILEIKNKTHAYYSWHRNDDGYAVKADSTWFFNRYWNPVDESQKKRFVLKLCFYILSFFILFILIWRRSAARMPNHVIRAYSAHLKIPLLYNRLQTSFYYILDHFKNSFLSFYVFLGQVYFGPINLFLVKWVVSRLQSCHNKPEMAQPMGILGSPLVCVDLGSKIKGL